MSRFFNKGTRTVYSVGSYAGAVKVPLDSIKIQEEAVDDSVLPEPPKLRRQNAGVLRQFFSSENNSIIWGTCDLNDHSNRDLTEVMDQITLK